MKRIAVFAFIIIGIFLAGCNKNAEMTLEKNKPNFKAQAGDYIIPIVDPDHNRIPFPNDLLIDQKTGRLNIPVFPTDSQAQTLVKWQLNTLDGFSTSTTMYVDFTYPIALSSVSSNDVLIINLTKFLNIPPSQLTSSNPITRVTVPFKVSYYSKMNRLILEPREILEPSDQYMVILKKGIKGINGVDVSPSPFYLFLTNQYPLYDTATSTSTVPALTNEQATLLEPIRENLQKIFPLFKEAGIAKKDDILILWTFTTQSVGSTLKKIIDDITNANNSHPEEFTAHFDSYPDLGTSVVPAVCVYAPSVTPAICGNVPEDSTLRSIYDNMVALEGSFPVTWVVEGYFYTRNYRAKLGYFSEDLSYVPEKIHFLLTLPSGQGPFPVVIYQHGITRNKKDIFAVAPGFAAAGFATIAIDLPDHGERVEGDTDLTGDGKPDGDRFIDPQNLLTTRDRMRQAVIDLVILSKVIKNWDNISDKFNFGGHLLPINDFDGNPSIYTNWFSIGPDGKGDLSSTNIYFVGHSLGAIIGGVFMAMSPDVNVGVLNAGGALAAKLLGNSLAFTPFLMQTIADTLGMDLTSSDFSKFWYDFIQSAQWLVDKGDPGNYARMWKEKGKKVLMVGSRFDPVVPDPFRDLLAEAGGLYDGTYSTLVTKSETLTNGGYIEWNSYYSYDVSSSQCQTPMQAFSLVPLLPYYLTTNNGVEYINIGNHSLMLTPAKVYCNLSYADAPPDSVYFMPYYLEMYNEIDSFLLSNGSQVSVTDTGTCSMIASHPSLCTNDQYKLTCAICQYAGGRELVFSGK